MKKYIVLLVVFNFFINNLSQGQAVKALQSENDGKYPRMQWYSRNIQDTAIFSVYRTGLEKIDFKPILTLQGTFSKGDSLIYWIVDTTLTEKALYKYFITLPHSNDSVIRSEILYGHNMGAIPSPQIVTFNAEPAEGRKAINLSWKLNYNYSVNSLAIYRSTKYDDGYELIARLSGEAESYTDPVEIANEAYYYFFIIHDYFGYQRPSVRFHGIATHKEKPITPHNFKLSKENNQANMTWERVGSNIIGYRVYRQIDNFGGFAPISKMFYTRDREVSYSDSTIKGLKNKDIEYYVTSISDGFVESNPSDTLSIQLQGEIHKGAPQECDYVLDSLNRIMLIWTSQEADVEVKGYNVYRIENESQKKKLNKSLISNNTNYFVDEENLQAGEYVYEIETVSITNTLSSNRTRTKVRIEDKPLHLLLSLKKTDKGILIKGVSLSQPDIKEIILYRQINSGELKQVAKLSPADINFTDINVKSDELYSYSAIAVYTDKSIKTVNAGVVMRY